MPNSEETTPTSSSSRTIVANEEDLLLTSSDDSSSSTSRISSSSPAGDSGYSKSSTPTSSVSTAPHHQAGSISGCSSMSEREEISFEGYGESDNHAVTTENSVEPDTAPATGMMSSGRTNWMGGMLRNSLRRSDYNSPGDGPFRRYGSLRLPGKRGAAISNQLGYGKNGISSGNRSLTNGGDLNGEDFCSDASLEDDVVDLGHKVNILQQQITVLADTQFSSDDRYSRSKQENAALTARLQMLEESLREVELRAQQQLSEEQRRNRELIVRVEREKQLEIENCTIKLQSVEREVELTREECARLRAQTERLRGERSALQQRLCEAETSLLEGQEELRRMSELMKREREQWAVETTNSRQLATELSSEIEALRNSQQFGSGGGSQQSPASTPRVSELESEIKSLKQQNNSLREANDELQAQLFSRGLEEGRTLLHDMATNSLAAEFEVMSQDDIRTALREAQEVNAQLRSYIEGILLTIVENQPSLLERKPPQ